MKSVWWALLVLLGGFLLQPTLTGPHAHNQAVKDRRWKDQLKAIKDYQIVVPRCLDKWGRDYPPEQHFLQRSRRSVSSDLQRDQSEVANSSQSEPSLRARGIKYYHFDAFGKRFSLELLPNQDFFSSNVLIQHIEGNYSVTRNITSVINSNCFHTGSVKEDPRSAVYLSICHSLRGSIQAFGNIYFIESHPDPNAIHDIELGADHSQDPYVKEEDGEDEFTEHQKAHIIYKMSDLDHYSSKTSHCHSKDHHKHKRWKDEEQISRLHNQTITFSSHEPWTGAHNLQVESSSGRSVSRDDDYKSTRTASIRTVSGHYTTLWSSSSPAIYRPAMVTPSNQQSPSNTSRNIPKLIKFDSLASLLSHLKRLASNPKPNIWSPFNKRAASPSSSSSSVSDPSHNLSSGSHLRPSLPDSLSADNAKRASSPSSSSSSSSSPTSSLLSSSSSWPGRQISRGLGRGRRSLHKEHQFAPHTGVYIENMVRRYVELLIVADRAMYEYYGDDVEHYVLTLMAVVASIYHDPTIGQPIDIVLVKLIVLKDNDKHGNLSISSNAIQTLKSFCAWQHRINTPETTPGHHDTAVLLTRENLCRSATKCDTLGLAELGTMCTPHKSCSIIEDNGLSSAFTVAHELGHVFSLPHDEHEACDRYHKPNEKHQMKAMAGTLDHTMQPWSWSDCSRGYMAEFIESGLGECLKNRPEHRHYVKHVQVAGDQYSADEQCVQVFGDDYEECSNVFPKCHRLWCQNKKYRTCITQHMPWADGTTCAPGAWCQRGVCVPRRQPIPVHGGWSSWSPYTNCTLPCGGGVMISERICNNPVPRNGGSYCTGARRRYKSCNTQDCPLNQPDFRISQCAKYNGKWYNINGLDKSVRWLPKYTGVSADERCKLICRANGTAAFYPLSRKVIDGTKCGLDTSDMCINGKCVPAGCDNVLNSTLRRDWCGICGGDNTQCHNISSYFTPTRVVYGYNQVVVLPKGAFNIKISQQSQTGDEEDDNYLAIRTAKRYLLNGNYSIILYREMITLDGGVQLEYSGTKTLRETITIKKPIPEHLYIEVLSVGALHPPVIYFNYTMYKPGSGIYSRSRHHQAVSPPPPSHVYRWKYDKKWSKCSRICYGQRKKSAVCVRVIDRRTVDPQYCKGSRPPPKVKRCKTYCRLKWTKVRQGSCSVRCGVGEAKVKWKCQRFWIRKRRIKYTSDKHCYLQQPKPSDREVCRGLCRPTHWEYSGWSKCSRSCGPGEQVAKAHCVDDMGNLWKSTDCDESSKILRRICNNGPCALWSVGDWKPCDCSIRRQSRHIWCIMNGKAVSKTYCERDKEPVRERQCLPADCPSWVTGTWSQCQAVFDTCTRHRTVKCRSSEGTFLDNEKCDKASRPSQMEDCDPEKCATFYTDWHSPTSDHSSTSSISTNSISITSSTTSSTKHRNRPTQTTDNTDAITTDVTDEVTETVTRQQPRWRTGSWAECSATCGKGTRMRYVSCRDTEGHIASDMYCADQPKPASVEVCVVKNCGIWRTGEWSTCSRSCGEGIASRLVACVSLEDLEYQRDKPVHCEISQRPSHEKICNHGECIPQKHFDIASISTNRVENTAHWRVGPWGACTKTCNVGSRRRRVVCQDETGPSNDCDPDSEPHDTEQCNMDPCPSWRVGAWGKCSVSCGGGQQQRIVSCLLPNNTVLEDAKCDLAQKPAQSQDCSTVTCPKNSDMHWYKGQWSQCSVTCGEGRKTRLTMCINKNGVHLADSYCKGRKPRNSKKCKQGKCPHWNTSEWGKCSTTCGQGVKSRNVFCEANNKQIVDNSLCSHLSKPDDITLCQVRKCGRFYWKHSRWSKCSVTCGQGVRTRSVACVLMESKRLVHPRYCPKAYKPRHRKRCMFRPCGQVWVTSEWQECSHRCGEGRQSRNVTCQKLTKEGWLMPQEATGCNKMDKPVAEKLCNYGECDAEHHWHMSSWSACSKTCGFGRQTRQVLCVNSNGQRTSNIKCLRLFKPDFSKSCYQGPCYASSCKELKKISAIDGDSDYHLLIEGQVRLIYCHNMATGHPLEYLTLPAGEEENFSEIFGKRLRQPNSCPSQNIKDGRCNACYRNKTYSRAGHTSYMKVRINITSLAIIVNDYEFSQSYGRRRIPFATAGDCYSNTQQCPQGSFQVNLARTGFRVRMDNSWYNKGYKTVSRISISEAGQLVRGLCGGHCGMCLPDASTGLLLEVQP